MRLARVIPALVFILGTTQVALGANLAELRDAAERGMSDAANQLGMAYYLGHGTPKDLREAAKWIRAAAEKNDPAAQANLAALYDRGDGVPRDPEQALQWYLKAAKRGNDLAQVLLGAKYEYAEGTAENPAEAFRWYERAAKADNVDGQYRVGLCYLNGKGVKQDFAKAYFWLVLACSGSEQTPANYEKAKAVAGGLLDEKEVQALDKRGEQWLAQKRKPARSLGMR